MTPECERLGLQATRIAEPWAVDVLRVIRNQCRDGFSFDNDLIEPEQQQRWWRAMAGHINGWLYEVHGDYVGYGLLRQTDDYRWWSSVAVVPDAAGHGYGGAITADLIRRSDVTIYASARLDNPVAMKLHREADWEEVYRDERLAHYVTRPHVHLATTMEDWAKNGWCLT